MSSFAMKYKLDRPCDACAIRKVKCDLANPCSRCIQHDIECSNSRVRRKCGPKKIHEKTRRAIQQTNRFDSIIKAKPDGNYCYIPLEKIIPFLQVYQVWFYSIWPLTSANTLISKICSATIDSTIKLDENNASEIAFAISLCAAIRQQLNLLSRKRPEMEYPEDISAVRFAEEVLRIRLLYEYRLNPNVNTLLTLFFMHAYYANTKGQHITSAFYLREAVSLVQILGLNKTRNYSGRTVAEAHVLQKVYYNVLIAERYHCIENGSSALLDSTIPFPYLRNEENPEKIAGFLELTKIFSIPSKSFLDDLISDWDNSGDLERPNYELSASKNVVPTTMIGIQKRLANIIPFPLTTDTDKLDLILSKSWMMALAWRLSYDSGILSYSAPQQPCFKMDFPFQIIQWFLADTKDLDTIAFECNRKGAQFKMLQIANTALISLKNCGQSEGRLDSLQQLFELIFNPKGLLYAEEEFEHLEGINTILKDYCKYFQTEGSFDIEVLLHIVFGSNVKEIQSEPENEMKNPKISNTDDEHNENNLTRDTFKEASNHFEIPLTDYCNLNDLTIEPYSCTGELNDIRKSEFASEMCTSDSPNFDLEKVYQAFHFSNKSPS
ncbi:uncharacterized protein PRCAT00002307001 [Priceomyces carsonii]|uniref:uncharacterized protein n=1 Tax=Priceomyces carsonii TaxID=28549 RepID=UPI002ED8E7CD|nr:unnamed protein product [Priceomyces carsonii]